MLLFSFCNQGCKSGHTWSLSGPDKPYSPALLLVNRCDGFSFLTSWATDSAAAHPLHLTSAELSPSGCAYPYLRTGPASTHTERATGVDLCWARKSSCGLLLTRVQHPSVVHVCCWIGCRQGQKPSSPVQHAHVLGCLMCCPALLWVWCEQWGGTSGAWVCANHLFASKGLSLLEVSELPPKADTFVMWVFNLTLACH